MNISPDDPRLSWYGVVSFEHGEGWIKPWRLPFEQRLLFARTCNDDQMLCRAGMCAGVRIVFRSNTELLEGQIEPLTPSKFNNAATNSANIDLVCDNVVYSSTSIGDQTCFRFDHLPKGEKLVEVWLPQYREIRLRSLRLTAGATVAPYEDKRRRWLVYGSSYTQSNGAASPCYTWPAVAARRRDLNHQNLAFGGQCHLDGMVGRLIRDIPCDFISMEIGINIYIYATMSERAFRAALIAFVQILRERHPTIPIAIMSPIYGWENETAANNVKLTLCDVRDLVGEAVVALRATGDANVHYFDGRCFLGEAERELIPDHVHPNGEGYKLFGERFAKQVIDHLLPPSTTS